MLITGELNIFGLHPLFPSSHACGQCEVCQVWLWKCSLPPWLPGRIMNVSLEALVSRDSLPLVHPLPVPSFVLRNVCRNENPVSLVIYQALLPTPWFTGIFNSQWNTINPTSRRKGNLCIVCFCCLESNVISLTWYWSSSIRSAFLSPPLQFSSAS